MQSLPPGSPVSLVFWCQELLLGDNPVWVKFECKEFNPLWKQLSCTHWPHNSGTIIDNAKNSINAIESRSWAFQRAINQGRASALTFPKWDSCWYSGHAPSECWWKWQLMWLSSWQRCEFCSAFYTVNRKKHQNVCHVFHKTLSILIKFGIQCLE